MRIRVRDEWEEEWSRRIFWHKLKVQLYLIRQVLTTKFGLIYYSATSGLVVAVAIQQWREGDILASLILFILAFSLISKLWDRLKR